MSDMDAASSSSEEQMSESSEGEASAPPVRALAQMTISDFSEVDIDTCEDFSVLLMILATENSERAQKAVKRIRRLLSTEKNPPIQAVIDAGGVDVLHKAMKHDIPEIRYEATWAVTNLFSGSTSQVSSVLQSHPIPTLLSMFTPSESWELKEQALWAIGNIAGDCTEYRNLLLDASALTAVLSNLNPQSESYMKNACWVVSNLVRGKPPPKATYLQQAGPFVLEMFDGRKMESETATDLMWALSYITEAAIEGIGLTHEKVQEVAKFCANANISIAIPALRSIGNIISTTDKFTQFLLHSGFPEILLTCLRSNKRAMRRETAWVLSNILAEGSQTLDFLIETPIYPALIEISQTDDPPVRKEAIWALANSCEGSNFEQKLRLLSLRIDQSLLFGLQEEENQTKSVALEGLKALFEGFQAAGRADLLESAMKIDVIIATVKPLAKNGVKKAKDLLRAMAWLARNDNELATE